MPMAAFATQSASTLSSRLNAGRSLGIDRAGRSIGVVPPIAMSARPRSSRADGAVSALSSPQGATLAVFAGRARPGSRLPALSAPSRRRRSIVPSSTADGAAAAPTPDDSSSSNAPPSAPSPGGLVAGFVRGLRGRMAADANFPFKLGAEVCLDEIMTVLVNIGVRGNPMEWALGAQLQVLCQMLTAAVNDIILVYCLAPVAGEAAADAAKKASDEPEIAHVFQEGDFTLAQRIGCYLAKGRFYALVGAVSCTFSMALALLLSGQLSQFTPEYLFRALMTGALHMGISANTRYQIVNGIERVLYGILPQGAARGASVATRLANNLLGARLWIVMTKITGLA